MKGPIKCVVITNISISQSSPHPTGGVCNYFEGGGIRLLSYNPQVYIFIYLYVSKNITKTQTPDFIVV